MSVYLLIVNKNNRNMTKKEIITQIVKAAGRINSDSLHKIYPRMTKKNKKLLEDAYKYILDGSVTPRQAIHIMTGIILA